ncbi:MAG: hypothetical protein V4757_06670 [Pseudomonadota bacterium]
MAGKLEIINVALGRIGANDIISLDEGTTEQKLAIAFYETSRKALLREHTWNFAVADVELARLASYTPFQFAYTYQLPADCLRLIEVYDCIDYRRQGSTVLSDETSCKVRYVKDVEDSSQWDASFTDVFSYRLAADMAYPLTKSQSVADSLTLLYGQKLKVARHIDATEDVLNTMGGQYSSIIAVRF